MSTGIFTSRISSDVLQNQSSQAGFAVAGDMTAAATARFGQALGGLGQAVAGYAELRKGIDDTISVSNRKDKFLKDADAIDASFQNDQDPATLEERYAERMKAAKQEATKGLSPVLSAELGQQLGRLETSYVQGARARGLKLQADGYSAGLDSQFETLTRRYTAAGSDAERETLTGELDATLASGVQRGLITQKSAEAYRQSMRATGDHALAYRDVARDPRGAAARLQDPAYMPGLPPMARAQLQEQARAAADELTVRSQVNRARLNPEAAPFIAGRITRPEDASVVFRSIIQQESNGNPNAVSPQGAAGLTQLMPDTAREMANKAGIDVFSGENDEGVRGILKANPALARRLGEAYFAQNLRQFDGHLAPAIAAYHAGTNSKPVMAAHRKALEQYGDTYTPAQFSALLPDWLADKDASGRPAKKTKDYVLDIFKRMGADPGSAAVSPAASWRITEGVAGVMQEEQARLRLIQTQLVRSAGTEADALAGLMTQGGMPDPQRFAAARATLSIGAQRGDTEAAAKIRSMDDALEMLPVIRQAWQTRPELREAQIAEMRGRIVSGGTVQPEEVKRLQLYEAVSKQQAEMRTSDPVGLAYRQGVAPAEMLDAQKPLNDPDLRAAMARRFAVMERGHAINGGERQFFQPQERIAWKARWADMGETDKTDMIRLLAETHQSEEGYRAAVKDITGGDQLAATAGRFMRSKPDLARDIIRGGALMQMEGVRSKAEDLTKALRARLGSDVFPPTVQNDVVNAALAVYAAERGRNATLYDPSDSAGLEAAIERVTGKIVRRNGKRVPLPDGVPESAFTEALDRLAPETLKAMGGARGRDGRPLDAGYVGRNALLEPYGVGTGQYLVSMPGAGRPSPVMDETGKQLVIDIQRAVELQRINTGGTAAGRVQRTLADQFNAERRALGIVPQGSAQ